MTALRAVFSHSIVAPVSLAGHAYLCGAVDAGNIYLRLWPRATIEVGCHLQRSCTCFGIALRSLTPAALSAAATLQEQAHANAEHYN